MSGREIDKCKVPFIHSTHFLPIVYGHFQFVIRKETSISMLYWYLCLDNLGPKKEGKIFFRFHILYLTSYLFRVIVFYPKYFKCQQYSRWIDSIEEAISTLKNKNSGASWMESLVRYLLVHPLWKKNSSQQFATLEDQNLNHLFLTLSISNPCL